MTFVGKTVLVTGANRGIGQALVEEALRRGAARVYAGTRQPLRHADRRVMPLTLDVTDAAQIQAALERVESLDILINNAGVALYDDLNDRSLLERHLAVNFFGPYEVTQAFLPMLTQSGGAIVNNVSVMALAPLPFTPSYAISKAAAFNLDPIHACPSGWAGRESPRRSDRPDGHRYDPRLRDPQGNSTVSGASHLRRGGNRRRRHFSGPHVGHFGGELARRCSQGIRA